MERDYLPIADMVIVYPDGTHRAIDAATSLLWYDWHGEYHLL